MIDFIVENYQFIALVVAGLIDVILLIFALCKKRSNPSIEKVIVSIPDWISCAERKYGAGHGEEKKLYVLDLCKALYKHLTGVSIGDGCHLFNLFSNTIENVLKTPQKKGK